VFNQGGILLGSVELPPQRQIIALGNRPDGEEIAYLVRTDDFDLKWLERYRILR
jgi:hypothetical protein